MSMMRSIALRDLIERRVNPNGVSEATVVTSYSNLSNTHKLVVELPGSY
jgi:hypothetical protein